MKSIETKYIGPSNVRGLRIKAFDGDNSLTVSYDYALNADQNHKAAAAAFARKLGWHGVWQGGHTKNGMVFVCPDDSLTFEIEKQPGPWQPKTGARCSCKPGIERDNCAACEGTGMLIDFAAIRAHCA